MMHLSENGGIFPLLVKQCIFIVQSLATPEKQKLE
jgi:hypothetical protein